MATFFLLLIYLAFISLGLPDSLLGTAWPVMQKEFHAPLETAGWLYTTIAAGTIVSSLASGKMIAKFGTGKITLVSCLMTAAALFGYSQSPSLVWLVLCAIPLGLGGGSVDAGLNHYVAANYKAHHMSWLHCFWGVGATMGPVIMANAMGDGSWRGGYGTVAAIQFGLAIVLLLTLPLWKKNNGNGRQENLDNDNAIDDSPVIEEGGAPKHPLRLKGVKFSLLSFLLYCGIEVTVGLWGSSYLVELKDLPASVAAQWVSMYYGGITVGRFITGFVTFKLSNRMLIRIGQMTALSGAALLVLPLPQAFSLAGFLIIGLGLAPIYPCLLHETPVRFGQKNAQTIMGYQMAVAYTGSTLVPPIVGFLAVTFSIGVFPYYLVATAAVMLILSERLNVYFHRRNQISHRRNQVSSRQA
ncbi:MFS transporter [Paenibacillus sp. LHD-117]|uniref:MFS transporter n=1 Tax=Paenibacillus sp. LHD-117 TaxID=3071412 RepID=UPI0027E0DD9C|nr:MFS transporter [Paenibacillus sp. LHD-117]MDQ6421725.1 MFS transporter [Paenibacillus sp. LHD-117]